MGNDLITRDLLGCCSKELRFGDSWSGEAYLEKRGSVLNHRHPSLDLRLVVGSLSSSATTRPSNGYQSVCTIEKVKSALERESRCKEKRQPSPSSSITTTSSLSIKRCRGDEDKDEDSEFSSSLSSSMMAAGCCYVCLIYVLISTENPRCPRCGSHVRVPVFTNNKKKPKIDLKAIQHI